MGVGIISSIGINEGILHDSYIDYDVTLVTQTSGVDNWLPYSTAGTNCYVYDFDVNTEYPGAGVTMQTDYAVIPRGTITEDLISRYSIINATCIFDTATTPGVDAPVPKIRFYCFAGKPTKDIPITVRIYNKKV